ncbi:hypothetical protein LTR37_021508 [Vermiconidia calcicola]|uniref:Uncharacterized protein n=1 Tax=Vermiconidia calcicola TaxID=1690605 RepID=A0ACC3M8L4_9PEZI|nr:hypothetical protein LTR37_021508 [Vermiconidia calcicola]
MLTAHSPPKSLGFLDLPREIRDDIYEECLVSNDMIELCNLRLDSARDRSNKQRLGLVPNLLRTCRQAQEEGSKILYGSNTFYVDIQPMWQYTRSRDIRDLLADQLCSQRPYACIACSDRVHAVHSARDANSKRSDMTVLQHWGTRMPGPSTTWIRQINLVRRLQIALRPYSYSQFADTRMIKFWLQGIAAKEDRELVCACSHSLQHAVPHFRHLDLLILHIAKPALAVAEEDLELSSAVLYPIGAAAWRRQVHQDMARETSWLLSFAKQSAKVIVIPSSGSAQGLGEGQRAYLERACGRPRRGVRESHQQLVNTIPDLFLRTGHLARLKSQDPPPEPSQACLVLFEANQVFSPDTVEAAIEHARLNRELPMLFKGPELVHDSL